MDLSMSPIKGSDRDFVGSLAKGLRVITAFNGTADRMTVADVAKATGMTRAGARRLMLTLHALGYFNSDGKLYSLSPKILELGFAYLSSQSWISLATPVLEALRDDLQEAVSVTALEGTEVVYVARFPADRVMTMAMDIGSRRPAYCTAMGRVFLAEMPEEDAYALLRRSRIERHTEQTLVDIEAIMTEVRKAREAGYALVDRELETSLVAVSVPLRNYHGETLAAINVCGHPSSLPIDDLEGRCLAALRSSCERLSQVLV